MFAGWFHTHICGIPSTAQPPRSFSRPTGVMLGRTPSGPGPGVDSGLPSLPGHSSVLTGKAGFGLLCLTGLRDRSLRIGPGLPSACCAPSLVTPRSSEGMVKQQLQAPRAVVSRSDPPRQVTVRWSAEATRPANPASSHLFRCSYSWAQHTQRAVTFQGAAQLGTLIWQSQSPFLDWPD